MLPEPKKRKIGSKTANCMLIGYAQNSAAYRFLVLKSDVLESNTIIETKNAEFFEHIYPLKEKVSHATKTLDAPLDDDVDKIDNVLRKSKRQRKETSFGDDFYTYVVSTDPMSFFETISSSDGNFWKEVIQTKLDSLIKNQTWELVDLSPRTKPIS